VTDADTKSDDAPRPTLDIAVRRRRADQEFFIRISKAIQQNQPALERLSL
jgi:hypothetical protein